VWLPPGNNVSKNLGAILSSLPTYHHHGITFKQKPRIHQSSNRTTIQSPPCHRVTSRIPYKPPSHDPSSTLQPLNLPQNPSYSFQHLFPSLSATQPSVCHNAPSFPPPSSDTHSCILDLHMGLSKAFGWK